MEDDKKELLKVLEVGREVLLGLNKKTKAYFNTGDLIHDIKNDEYGIYIGEKPIQFSGSSVKYLFKQKYDSDSSKSTTAILLTLTKKEFEEYTSGDSEDDHFDWRVRYTPHSCINKLQDIKTYLKEESENDLKTFCETQCIQDCSEDCILRKHRNRK